MAPHKQLQVRGAGGRRWPRFMKIGENFLGSRLGLKFELLFLPQRYQNGLKISSNTVTFLKLMLSTGKHCNWWEYETILGLVSLVLGH